MSSSSASLRAGQRCLASTASGNSRRHHGVVIGAQARSTTRCNQSSRFEVKPVDRPGKLGTLVRGAQSERPRKERQSGVVKVNGRLRGEVH